MAAPLQVALFGGTFDPVHEGHLEIAAKAVEELKLDSIIFIPCQQSPHKDRAPGAGSRDRLAMLRLATSSIPSAEIDDFELRKPPPSYSWETVAHFSSKFPPGTLLHLLIGLDQWENLLLWKNLDFLKKKVIFVVVGREKQPTPRPGFRACFIPGNHPASSRQIRRDLRNGSPPRWLPKSVAQYIRKKALYLPTT